MVIQVGNKDLVHCPLYSLEFHHYCSLYQVQTWWLIYLSHDASMANDSLSGCVLHYTEKLIKHVITYPPP